MFVCPICIETFRTSEENVVTKCGHVFHKSCLLDWFDRDRNENSCPSCRSNTNRRSFDIFLTYDEYFENDLKSTNNDLNALRIEYSKTKNSLNESNKLINDLTKKRQNLVTELNGLKKNNKSLKEYISSLLTDNKDLIKKCNQFKTNEVVSNNTISSLTLENQGLRKTIVDLSSKIEFMENTLDDVISANTFLKTTNLKLFLENKTLDTLRQTNVDLSTKIKDTTNALEKEISDNEVLRTQNFEIFRKNKALKADLEKLNQMQYYSTSDIAFLKRKLFQKDCEIERIQQKLDEEIKKLSVVKIIGFIIILFLFVCLILPHHEKK